MGKSLWEISSSSDDQKLSRDSSLFSSSLPIIPNEKLNVNNHDLGESNLFDIVENLLPDDEYELFSGIIDGFDMGGSTRCVDHLEEYEDLFGSGGGIELESDCCSVSKLNLSGSVPNNGMLRYFTGQNCVGGTVIGEHPAGEHPSRTLFVRNINSNVEDSELRELFQVYGDIRSLYTACKHRGFVMISYYDIRAANTALRALQNKPLRRRKLDIHFSIPKDNPSDKDLNQGTLLLFNLDQSDSKEDLLQIFGVYGEIKEIRETPLKRHHKFIEFYDTRASEAALRALNRHDIAGKSIKLEPSRPGGARRNQDQDQDEPPFLCHQLSSSFGNSPSGNWSQIGGAVEQAHLSSLGKSPEYQSPSPTMSNLSYPNAFQQSLSFPDSKSIMFPRTLSSFVSSSSNGSGFDTLSGSQSIWGSPKVYSEPTNFSSLREQPFQHPLLSSTRARGFSFSGHGPFLNPIQAHSTNHHHVGSAPSERYTNFNHDPQETFMNRTAQRFEYSPIYQSLMMNMGASSSKIYENMASGFSTMHSPGVRHMFIGSLEGFHDCGYNNGNNLDNKQQFQLDFEKIKRGEDSRTTLMIKNIPNKYNSKMLLEAIDENFRGTYDFLYLPIDFRNRCNVGYAFINMLSPLLIIPFYEALNGKKWERFNSEKVAYLAYARIQGKTALVAHFHNSSVMIEDKRCRPIVFQQEFAESGDQAIHEQFQVHKSNGSEMKEHSGRLSEDIWYQ